MIRQGIISPAWRHVISNAWKHVVHPDESPKPEDFLALEDGYLLDQENGYHIVTDRIVGA